MKIRPVILCGGAGTRIWPQSKDNLAKQFIDFGGWSLLEKTLKRVKSPIFDYPIISTNLKYLELVKGYLKKFKFDKYRIVLEPSKRNTASAVLASSLIKEIPEKQPLLFLAADQLMEKENIFNKVINKNKINLTDQNIFIFGIKPNNPSSKYGYFLTKKVKKNLNKVTKFIEKPNESRAKMIIKKKGCWNSGIFFMRKDSILKNFKKYQPAIYKNCFKAITKSNFKKNIYYLDKISFNKSISKSFDVAILEKSKQVNAIKLTIPWSDLGSWSEICKMYNRDKSKYYDKKNVFFRPWGKYVNLFKGKGFLIKELLVKSKGCLSLQKHKHRSEHWLIISGVATVIINNNNYKLTKGMSIDIPKLSHHYVENKSTKKLIIVETQLGTYFGEDDIIRIDDPYNR